MSDKPISFSGPMVQAILEGRKSMTRRPVEAKNSTVLGRNVTQKATLWTGLVWDDRVYVDGGPQQYLHVPWVNPREEGDDRVFRVRSRIEIGDRLWGKETWATEKRLDHLASRELDKAASIPLWFSADLGNGLLERGKWRPSIFMPRWASRIMLEVTGVRAARIQEITIKDCLAEGMIPAKEYENEPFPFNCKGLVTAFASQWDTLNAKSGHGWWDKNDWVWVYSFEVM